MSVSIGMQSLRTQDAAINGPVLLPYCQEEANLHTRTTTTLSRGHKAVSDGGPNGLSAIEIWKAWGTRQPSSRSGVF